MKRLNTDLKLARAGVVDNAVAQTIAAWTRLCICHRTNGNPNTTASPMATLSPPGPDPQVSPRDEFSRRIFVAEDAKTQAEGRTCLAQGRCQEDREPALLPFPNI